MESDHYINQYQHRIPARPSPTAPPPPQAPPPPPPPSYSKQQPKPKKQKTRKQLRLSQIKTVVAIIILFVIYFTLVYLAFTQYIIDDSYEMDSDQDTFANWFRVPDIMSQDVPVKIEVTTSEDVQFFIIKGEDYTEDLSESELQVLALSETKGKSRDFIYISDLEPGEYYIVTYAEDNEKPIEHEYMITIYILMPFLGLFSLLFILPIIIGLVWILVLQRRKTQAQPNQQYHTDYYHDNSRQSEYDQHYGYSEYDHDRGEDDGYYHEGYSYQQERPPVKHNPAHEHSIPTQQHMSQPYRRAPGPHGHGPMPPPGKSMQRQPTGQGLPTRDNDVVKTTAVPCKCGEIIVVNDPTRPLRIKCPRCGRRGILEGKKKSDEDDIFY